MLKTKSLKLKNNDSSDGSKKKTATRYGKSPDSKKKPESNKKLSYAKRLASYNEEHKIISDAIPSIFDSRNVTRKTEKQNSKVTRETTTRKTETRRTESRRTESRRTESQPPLLRRTLRRSTFKRPTFKVKPR